MATAESWLLAMHKEIGEMFGAVGNNPSMQSYVELAAICWNWSHLLFNKPRAREKHAFLELWNQSLPFLSKGGFPPSSSFPNVPKTWTLSSKALANQYGFLLHRVRAAYEALSDDKVNTVSLDVPKDQLLKE
eukprot:2839300-Karenia_brevis.AAC.1